MIRNVLLRTFAILLVGLLPLATVSHAERDGKGRPGAPGKAAGQPEDQVDPAFARMLGGGAPPQRVERISLSLRAGSVVPGAAADLPIFAVLQDTGEPGKPKYEAAGIAVDLVTDGYGRLRVENARVALLPSADGRSCRFELSGAPFGATSTFEASGTVEWATGPAGGDKVDMVFRLGNAPVEAVRAFLPNRIDPSFRGNLDLHGKASGVVGERTSEEMPATPLRGDLEASLDWQVLGRTAPLAITTQFSIDDRMVRLRDARMAWAGLALAVKGWFDPAPKGKFELAGSFSDVDTLEVATEWNVPEAWRPVSTLSGTITLHGEPGEGLMRYEASAPSIEVPALDGHTIRIETARLQGSLVAINADVAVSIRARSIRVGDLNLGSLPVGLRWWHDKLTASSSNTALWGGENDGSLAYEPAKHPEFSLSGRVKNAVAREMLANAAPWIGLDVDGTSAVAFSLGQDAARTPRWAAHASLLNGRLGGVDLFARTLEALAAVDPALALPDLATVVPAPRAGVGTRVDKLFTEIEKKGDTFDLGGFYLKGGEFQLDADGSFTRTGGVRLEGTVTVPSSVASRLVGAAPWLATLRVADGPMFVPVVVSGDPAALRVALAPDYGALLARASKGEKVEAPGVRVVRHVGPDNLATIPGGPEAAALP